MSRVLYAVPEKGIAHTWAFVGEGQVQWPE